MVRRTSTQALLDLFTIMDEKNLSDNLKVLFCR